MRSPVTSQYIISPFYWGFPIFVPEGHSVRIPKNIRGREKSDDLAPCQIRKSLNEGAHGHCIYFRSVRLQLWYI